MGPRLHPMSVEKHAVGCRNPARAAAPRTPLRRAPPHGGGSPFRSAPAHPRWSELKRPRPVREWLSGLRSSHRPLCAPPYLPLLPQYCASILESLATPLTPESLDRTDSDACHLSYRGGIPAEGACPAGPCRVPCGGCRVAQGVWTLRPPGDKRSGTACSPRHICFVRQTPKQL